MKVLIIEDNKDINYITKEILEEYNIEAIIAETGTEAYNILFNSKNSEFAYIIVDIMLPDENGVEIIRYIKKNLITKIIVFTGCMFDYSDKCDHDYFFTKGIHKIQDFTDIIIDDFLSRYH